MKSIWFSSDWHFSHKNILNFTDSTGHLIRPGFSCIEEMDEHIIERHNAVVKPTDKFYVLGDIGFDKTELSKILPRLNGRKRLILGNHDTFDMKFYRQYFAKIRESFRPVRDTLFTHRPVLFDSNSSGVEKLKWNVHGHLHSNVTTDYRHINICMEMIDYTPVNWEEIQDMCERAQYDMETFGIRSE